MRLRFSTSDELELAEHAARLGGLNSPSDDELWEIAEAISDSQLTELYFADGRDVTDKGGE